jgi:hypothetical protein
LMNLGFMDTTQRRCNNHLGGKRQIHRKPRNHKFETVSNQCELFFYTEGIVHKEFVPAGQTVNGNLYYDVLRWLKENVH